MLSKETKFFTAVIVILFLIIAIWLLALSPAPITEEIIYEDNRPARGNSKAVVVITNYFDFYCPLCREADFELNKIYQEYGEGIRIKYRYFPLSDNSVLTDLAAECAQQQGKFFAYHDLLFIDQGQEVNRDNLKRLALQSGLDGRKFDDCLDEEETLAIVSYDLRQAIKLGVTGAPTIFINEQKVDWHNLEAEVSRYLIRLN